MTVAILFGDKNLGVRKRMMQLRDDLQIDIYSSVDDLISGSKTRNKTYNRVIILSKIISPPANTNKALNELYNYWRSFCSSTEFVLYCRTGHDDELAKKFTNVMCSPLCTAVSVQNSTTVILENLASWSIAELNKEYGCEMEVDLELEVDSYVEEEPKPTPQIPQKPKKEGIFTKFFGKKNKKNTGAQASVQEQHEEIQQQEQTPEQGVSDPENPDFQDNYENYDNYPEGDDQHENDESYPDEQGSYDSEGYANYDDGYYENSGEQDGFYGEADSTQYADEQQNSDVVYDEASSNQQGISGENFAEDEQYDDFYAAVNRSNTLEDSYSEEDTDGDFEGNDEAGFDEFDSSLLDDFIDNQPSESVAEDSQNDGTQEQERLEAERLAVEKAEQERLAAEKAEQERIAKEKAEQEEKARLEAERLAAEKAEQERIEAERLAAEKAEQERIEAERLAAEKAEQERIEAERLAAEKAEQERLEAERLAAEKAEQECLEQERLEHERLAREQAERERIEREEAERREQERLAAEQAEKERLEKERLEAERLEQERLAREKAEQERLEQERLAREQAERAAQERARLEAERLEQERQAALAKEEEERKAREAEKLRREQEEAAKRQAMEQSKQVTMAGEGTPTVEDTGKVQKKGRLSSLFGGKKGKDKGSKPSILPRRAKPQSVEMSLDESEDTQEQQIPSSFAPRGAENSSDTSDSSSYNGYKDNDFMSESDFGQDIEPEPFTEPAQTSQPAQRPSFKERGTQQPSANVQPTPQAEGSEDDLASLDDEDFFADIDVGELDSAYKEAEQASNVRVERVEVVKEVIKEMPTGGKSKKVLSSLFSGKGNRVFIVTGDRGAGATTLAYEMAQEIAKHVAVLYYDGDTVNHGLLNYLDYTRFCEYDSSAQQGARLAKSVNAFKNCAMRYDNNIDILSSNFGVEVSDEEYESVQSVVADISNDYNVVIADIPFSKLPLCSELISVSTTIIVAERSKRGMMNLACQFDRCKLPIRAKRRISSMGTIVLTKGDSKVDAKKLKRYVSDIVEFDEEDSNWLNMKMVNRDKMSSKFLQEIIE
jgi:hypothetical protein